LYGGAIFRLAKPKCKITGRDDSFYENFITKSTLKVKINYVFNLFQTIKSIYFSNALPANFMPNQASLFNK